MLEWKRDLEKEEKKKKKRKEKKRKEQKKTSQGDQMLELTFNFTLGSSNLSFSKINSPCSPKAKAKEKQRKIKRKRKKKKNNKGE